MRGSLWWGRAAFKKGTNAVNDFRICKPFEPVLARTSLARKKYNHLQMYMNYKNR